MTHRDRAGDPTGQRAGRRGAAGPAGHRQGFPTSSAGAPARSLWVIINAPWYNMKRHSRRSTNGRNWRVPKPRAKPRLNLIRWLGSCALDVRSECQLFPIEGLIRGIRLQGKL